jgi:hypothetical protein
MKVRPLGSNMTEIQKTISFLGAPIKYTFLVSYETPVAVNVSDEYVGVKTLITEKKWSLTTSRHITKWLDTVEMPSGVSTVETVPQEEIERLFDL